MPPIIDQNKCTGCGICVDVCTEDVFFGSEKGKVPVVTYPVKVPFEMFVGAKNISVAQIVILAYFISLSNQKRLLFPSSQYHCTKAEQ